MARVRIPSFPARGSSMKPSGPWAYFRSAPDRECFADTDLRHLVDAAHARALPESAFRAFLRPSTGGVSHSMSRNCWGALLVLVSACGSPVPGGDVLPRGTAPAALGIGSAADDLRTGWYPTQPRLSPASVSAPDFGQLFTPVSLDGQIYAQPLLANGVVLVVTETNHIYTLDPVNGV